MAEGIHSFVYISPQQIELKAVVKDAISRKKITLDKNTEYWVKFTKTGQKEGDCKPSLELIDEQEYSENYSNLSVLRFKNPYFESIANNASIKAVDFEVLILDNKFDVIREKIQNPEEFDRETYNKLFELLIDSEKVDILVLLLEKQSKEALDEDSKRHAVFKAAETGNLELLNLLHTRDILLVNAQDWDGNRPILIAIEHNQLEMVKHLINYGADYQFELPNGYNTITYAKYYDSQEIVNYLKGLGQKEKDLKMCGMGMHSQSHNLCLEVQLTAGSTLFSEGSIYGEVIQFYPRIKIFNALGFSGGIGVMLTHGYGEYPVERIKGEHLFSKDPDYTLTTFSFNLDLTIPITHDLNFEVFGPVYYTTKVIISDNENSEEAALAGGYLFNVVGVSNFGVNLGYDINKIISIKYSLFATTIPDIYAGARDSERIGRAC